MDDSGLDTELDGQVDGVGGDPSRVPVRRGVDAQHVRDRVVLVGDARSQLDRAPGIR